MSIRTIAPPVTEPLTLEEAKAHVNVEHDQDDAMLLVMIAAARENAEALTQRTLITTTKELALDAFPEGEIVLREPPTQSIVSIFYVDPTGATKTLDSSAYVLDLTTRPFAWVFPAAGTSWPDTFDMAGAVRIHFKAGYGDTASSVPARIRSWMLLMVGTLYAHREQFVTGTMVTELPNGYVDRLLDHYLVHEA